MFTFFDLFSGIGGFRLAMEANEGLCVASCEIDALARETYELNFGCDRHPFFHDIKATDMRDIPAHDLLCAGFPCQSFSLANLKRKGIQDTEKGDLIHWIFEVLRVRRPKAFILENVKGLKAIDKGETFKFIIKYLNYDLGYITKSKVLNSLGYTPQSRERLFIVGLRADITHLACMENGFRFGQLNNPYKARTIAHVLEPEAEVSDDYYLTDRQLVKLARNKNREHLSFGTRELRTCDPTFTITQSHGRTNPTESHIRTERGLRVFTERELARLFGFPDWFALPFDRSVSNHRKAQDLFGNSVVVPLVTDIGSLLAPILDGKAR